MNPISNDVRRLMGAVTGLCLVAATGPVARADDAGLVGGPQVHEASIPGAIPAAGSSSPELTDGTLGPGAVFTGVASIQAESTIAPAPPVSKPPAQPARTTAPTAAPWPAPSAAATTVTAPSCAAVGAPNIAHPPANPTQPLSPTTSHEQSAGALATPATESAPALLSSLLLVSAGGVIGATATGVATRRRRPRDAEQERPAKTPAVSDRLARAPEPFTSRGTCLPANPGETAAAESDSARAAESVPSLVAPPKRMRIEQLADIAERWCGLDEPSQELFDELDLPAKLGSLFGPRAGMVSVTGPVRSRNEDAALLLGLENGCTMLMAADGMGGHPDGHLASRLALLGVCVGLREALHRPLAISSERLLRHAFSRARWTLRQATRAGRLKPGAGTTLIATLVESDHYVTAYLGDGGAYVRRADGGVEALMMVQKVQSNLLDRYLSADSPASWRPQVSRVARRPQDTVAIGSDGVMDRVDIQTVLSWLASNVATKGLSMPQAVRQLLANFARLLADDGEPIADDNMTLLAVRMR